MTSTAPATWPRRSPLNKAIAGPTGLAGPDLAALPAVAGIGVDAVDVARFRAILARRPRFADRYFSARERADAARSPDPSESLAARFAAKEAVMKALGTGLGGFPLTDVEVERSTAGGASSGDPSLVLRGAAADLARAQGAAHLHLSLTHTDQVAIAFVVAERTPCSPS